MGFECCDLNWPSWTTKTRYILLLWRNCQKTFLWISFRSFLFETRKKCIIQGHRVNTTLLSYYLYSNNAANSAPVSILLTCVRRETVVYLSLFLQQKAGDPIASKVPLFEIFYFMFFSWISFSPDPSIVSDIFGKFAKIFATRDWPAISTTQCKDTQYSQERNCTAIVPIPCSSSIIY